MGATVAMTILVAVRQNPRLRAFWRRLALFGGVRAPAWPPAGSRSTKIHLKSGYAAELTSPGGGRRA